MLAGGRHVAPRPVHGLHHVGQPCRRVVDGHEHRAWALLGDAEHERQAHDRSGIEQAGGLDPDDIATLGLAPQLVGWCERDEAAVRDERDRVAGLGLADVLRGHQQRPPGIAQAVQLLPDGGAQDRIDPRRGLVEEQQCRLVDERAGKLEPSLHPARQGPGLAAADIPQLHELERLACPPVAAAPQHAEQ